MQNKAINKFNYRCTETEKAHFTRLFIIDADLVRTGRCPCTALMLGTILRFLAMSNGNGAKYGYHQMTRDKQYNHQQIIEYI